MSVAEKVCKGCGIKKPATAEYFHKHKDCRDGLRPRCKVCRQPESKAYRAENLERIKADGRVYYSENKQARAAYTKFWRAENSDKLKVDKAVYYLENLDKIALKHKAYYDENAERLNAVSRQYYRENKEAILAYNRAAYAANPEPIKTRAKAWRKANPEKELALGHRKRARKRNAEGIHTADDVARQFNLQGGKCYWCGCKLKKSGKGKYHVDHIYPLSKGGSNAPSNICCACRTCNLSKHAKTPYEFSGRLF